MVTITLEEYEKLKSDSFWLHCLDEAGVDNWSGIEYAVDLANEYRKEQAID